MTIDDVLISNCVKAWRFLYKRGFIEGFGHLSARLPGSNQFLITRHSLGLTASADDFLVLDLDGRKLSGKGNVPGEAPIHLEIYRARPDVASVVHYHGMYSTAFTTTDYTLQPIHLIGTIFDDGIPVYPDPKPIQNRQRGADLAKALGSHRAILMRAHGATITGASLEEAVGGAFAFEQNAQRAYISASIGKPLWLDQKTIAECAAGRPGGPGRGPFHRIWAMVESDAEE